MKTIFDFKRNGLAALRYVVESSTYGTLTQAVASLALFSHPVTVNQTKNQPVFRMARGKRGDVDDIKKLVQDDNAGGHAAFLWGNKLPPVTKSYLQINHIWGRAKHVLYHTCLANLCATPIFLAKLTDDLPEVQHCLQYRAFKLYGWYPSDETGKSEPQKPEFYDDLEWAETLPPVDNLKEVYQKQMRTKPRNRTVISARLFGWCFSDFQPVQTI